MLILAGVAVSVLTEDGGLFGKTKDSAEAYKNSAEEENSIISSLVGKIDESLGNKKEWLEIKAEYYDFDANAVGNWVEIIKDETTLQGTEIKYYFAKSNDNSTWTEYNEDITAEGSSRYLKLKVVYQKESSSITSTPVLNDFYIKCNVGDTEKIFKLKASIGTMMDKNQTYDGKTVGTYNNPIIPKGFAPINENGAEWGTSTGYQKGLVITDAFDSATGKSIGNEFVWVPVAENADGSGVTFSRKDFGSQHIYAGTYSNYVETELPALTESVNSNGGFYIARYEAGKENSKLVSKAGVTVYGTISWADSKTQAQNMYSETDSLHNVISTLIYGAQWDTTLKFIEAYDIGEAGYATYATNAAGMGFYQGTGGGATPNPAKCGSSSNYRQKNIYDMAGNAWEWCMEIYNNSQGVLRGGEHRNTAANTPAHRFGYSDRGASVGFRVALYIVDNKN